MQLKTPLVSNRLLYIDSIRALAAIFVVMHHAVVNYYDPFVENIASFSDYKLHGIKLIIVKIFYQGHYAVDLFIVLSGFSLMLSVLNRNYQLKGGILLFFKRRVIRIIPTYYSAIALSLILIWTVIGDKTYTHWDRSIPVNMVDIITHILLIHDFFITTSSHINHVFWSIVVECRIYLFFPVLLWIWRKKGAVTAVLFSVLISVTGFFALGVFKDLIYTGIDTESSGVSPYIILFTMGMLAADLSFSSGKTDKNIQSFYKKSPFQFIAIGIFLVAVIFGTARMFLRLNSLRFIDIKVFSTHLIDIAIGVLCAMFLFSVTISTTKHDKKSLILRILNWKPLVFVGTFSYSLYLVHPLVLQLVSKFIVIPLKADRFTAACQLLVIGTFASILVSYIFFLCFELPFLKMGKMKAIDKETIINPAP